MSNYLNDISEFEIFSLNDYVNISKSFENKIFFKIAWKYPKSENDQ